MLFGSRLSRSIIKRTLKQTTVLSSSFDSILRLKTDIHDYWESLPSETYCRDITASGPLYRSNVHLALTYHLVHIFIGRMFSLSPLPRSSAEISNSPTEQARHTHLKVRRELVSASVQSALSVIDLCQDLHDKAGLARASYTEFTTCKAALFVVLARRMYEPNVSLRKASEQGLTLIKSMSLGIYGASAEKQLIEAMETAVRRLDERAEGIKQKRAKSAGPANSAYDQFRNWATLRKHDYSDSRTSATSHTAISSNELLPSLESAYLTNFEPLQDLDWDMYSPSYPFDFGDLGHTIGYHNFEGISDV